MPWIIKCNHGKAHVWANKKEDDFIRFLPDHFDCAKEDLEFYWVDDKSLDGNTPQHVLHKKKNREGFKLKEWPYTEDDKVAFKGNKFKVEPEFDDRVPTLDEEKPQSE